MRSQYLQITTKLPSYNEIISANRSHACAGNNLKQTVEAGIAADIIFSQLRHVDGPCVVYMVFREDSRRRDADNVRSAAKSILDALVKRGVPTDDSPRYVLDTPSYVWYGYKQGVDVWLIEGGEQELNEMLMRSMDCIGEPAAACQMARGQV